MHHNKFEIPAIHLAFPTSIHHHKILYGQIFPSFSTNILITVIKFKILLMKKSKEIMTIF